MKAIGIMEFGGLEVLKVVDLPEPEPAAGEVRIRVHAVAVNPTDITFRSGGRAAQLAGRPGPYVPGMDVAGVIDKLGEGTDGRLAVGDPVIAYVIPFGPHGGTYAEKIVVTASSVVPAPRGASFPEASTLLLNATTARLAVDALGLAAGAMLAVVGGAGAVGGYAIQLAKADGLKVLADASPSDEELVRSLGADVLVERGSEIAPQIRGQLPDRVPGLIDGAALDALALPAIADGGGLATLKGWAGPSERGIVIHPISSFNSATNTILFDRLRSQADDGVLTLRVAGTTHGVGLASGREPYSTRAASMSARCASAHPATATSGTSSVLPSAVNEYSTRGGTTGYTTRSTSPSRSSWRSVSVSIRCEMPSIDRCSSVKRMVPSPRSVMTKTLHLSPMRVRTSRMVVQPGSFGDRRGSVRKAIVMLVTSVYVRHMRMRTSLSCVPHKQ